MSQYSLVVIGSGPGIGSHVARQFVKQGFSKVALVARNSTQLVKDRASVEEATRGANVVVKTYSVDITDREKLQSTLEQIEIDLGSPEVVFFNAARVLPSTLLETNNDEMVYDFKITVNALHQTAKWAIPQLTRLAKTDPSAKPSLIVTSSHLPREPLPEVFVLSLTKAAQRNLTESLAKVYGPQGVHVGLVIVAGMVAADNEKLNPLHIAEQTFELYNQEKDEWTLEVDIRE